MVICKFDLISLDCRLGPGTQAQSAKILPQHLSLRAPLLAFFRQAIMVNGCFYEKTLKHYLSLIIVTRTTCIALKVRPKPIPSSEKWSSKLLHCVGDCIQRCRPCPIRCFQRLQMLQLRRPKICHGLTLTSLVWQGGSSVWFGSGMATDFYKRIKGEQDSIDSTM
jgi:hypothetical protein